MDPESLKFSLHFASLDYDARQTRTEINKIKLRLKELVAPLKNQRFVNS